MRWITHGPIAWGIPHRLPGDLPGKFTQRRCNGHVNISAACRSRDSQKPSERLSLVTPELAHWMQLDLGTVQLVDKAGGDNCFKSMDARYPMVSL